MLEKLFVVALCLPLTIPASPKTRNSSLPLRSPSPTSVSGFSLDGRIIDNQRVSEPTGYFYMSLDIYHTDFTSQSRIYLMKLRTDFTCGKQAVLNDENGYDWNYRLQSGYVHLGLGSDSNNHYLDSFPNSSVTTVTYGSSFGSTYTFNQQLQAGVSVDGLSLLGGNSTGLSIANQSSVLFTKDEPSLSHQGSGNDSWIQQWEFNFKDPSEVTYSLTSYYLFERKIDHRFRNPYSFSYNVDIKLTCTAWEHYIWHQLRDTRNTLANGSFSGNE